MKAAYSGDVEELKNLISAGGIDLNERSRYGWTALMFASWRGSYHCAKVLLSEGADPNLFSDKVPSSFETTLGHPPTTTLREAVRSVRIEIANLLLDNGAKVDSDAMALAAQNCDIQLVERMKQLGGDVNKESHSFLYATPLCAASSAGKLEMAQWLMINGADVNLEAIGQTPLLCAVEGDQVEVVKFLLQNGANPNSVSSTTKDSVLIEAVTKETHYRNYEDNLLIIKLLLSHGVNKKFKGFVGKTALEILIKNVENGRKVLRSSSDPIHRKQLRRRLKHREAIIAILKR